MPTLAAEHNLGMHRRRKYRECPGCFTIAKVAAAPKAPVVIEAPDVPGWERDAKGEPQPTKEFLTLKRNSGKRKATVEAVAEAIAEKGSEAILVVGPDAPTITREAWLLAATQRMSPWFTEAGVPLPEVRVSVGWPAGRSAKKNTIGQCFQSPLVADGLPAIFISPVLTAPVEVLATLAHELVHSAVEVSSAPHRGPFVKAAKAIGLVGPWTATTAGEELRQRLTTMAEELGPFTHAAVSKGLGGGGRIVQGTRMLKVQCPGCECVIRMTRKWLDEAGAPTCGCGTQMLEAV